MGASTRFDQLAGCAEVLLVVVSLVWLIAACARPRRRHAVGAVVLSLVLAVTVAQPFGVTREPITAQEFAAGDPRPVDAEAVHAIHVLGIPLLRFKPVTREIFMVNGQGEDPTWLKVRSWVGLPFLLTNATKLEEMCIDDFSPCWDPEDTGTTENLELVDADGQWRYRILTRDGRPSEVSGERWGDGHYRLEAGVVSWAGLAYWIVAAALSGVLLRRRREAPAGDRSAAGGPAQRAD